MRILIFVLLIGYALVVIAVALAQRSLLFFPSHGAEGRGLTPWLSDGKTIGYCRSVAAPRNVWLMLHGNGGQASDRGYALPHFAADDSVFVMEYPGYGGRPGVPSQRSFDAAAVEAYDVLRRAFPRVPVCVFAESIGGGPAAMLCALPRPPDKLVLVVPFDRLSNVAADKFWFIPVRLLMRDNWDNLAALAHYAGPVDIIGAQDDRIIPLKHARALAGGLPKANFSVIPGGHNDWAHQPGVKIRNP